MDDDCTCEFDYPEPDGEPSWHYTRACRMCGTTWGALHCEHDGYQNPCPDCGWIDPGKQAASKAIRGINVGRDLGMHNELFMASPDGKAEQERIQQILNQLPDASGEFTGYFQRGDEP